VPVAVVFQALRMKIHEEGVVQTNAVELTRRGEPCSANLRASVSRASGAQSLHCVLWTERKHVAAALRAIYRAPTKGADRRGLQGFVASSTGPTRLASLTRGGEIGVHSTESPAVTVLDLRDFGVTVDSRLGTPTFGRWLRIDLNGSRKSPLRVPLCFLHCFVVLENGAVFVDQCTDVYESVAASRMSVSRCSPYAQGSATHPRRMGGT